MRTAHAGRTVTVVNGAMALALVAILATVALVAAPPSPPGIAEFAPQATKPITKAPPGQASSIGTRSRACVAGGTCSAGSRHQPSPLKSPSSRGVGTPSALQCYTWPDGSVTQTFDPQSPPCIASWPDAAKGNGGATWRGVTGRTIRVSAPDLSSTYKGALIADQAMISFLNSHFELYGRQLVLTEFAPTQGTKAAGPPDPAKQRADAETVASQLGSFAALSYADRTQSYAADFSDTLADKHVITVNSVTFYESAAELAGHAPYEWNFRATIDQAESEVGAVYCRQLNSRVARYGGSDVAGQSRRLGVLVPSFGNGTASPKTSALTQQLTKCHVTPQVANYPSNNQVQPGDASDAQTLLNFRNRGVTTILPLGQPSDVINLMLEAQNIDYTPEWLMPGVGLEDGGEYSVPPASQTAHLFGIGPENKPLPLGKEPWYVTATEGNSAVASYQYTTSANEYNPDGQAFYQSLLLLATGIQEAGPRLTPATFQSGLQATTFPDPGAGSAPLFQGGVSFADNDHVMINDFALKWWSPKAPDWQDGNQPPGDWCRVGDGRRFTTANLPTGDSAYFTTSSPCT